MACNSLYLCHTSYITRLMSLVTCHTSHVTIPRGDSLTAIDGTSIVEISGGAVGEDAGSTLSSGQRDSGSGSGRRLNQDSLRSLIVGPEGLGGFCFEDLFGVLRQCFAP